MDSSHRILVLTSDPDQRKHLFSILTADRMTARCPAGAAETLAIDREWHADLLIADFHFADHPVTDLIDALHQQNANLRSIILLPNGHTLDAMRELRCRPVAFLTRPFDPADLLYYVRSALLQTESGPNRREHHRYPFNLETHIVLVNPFDHSQSRPIPSLMRDVSRSGVSMIVRQLLPVPSMLRLTLQLSDQSRPLSMLSKTVSCMLTQISGVYRIGAKFIGLLPRELAERLQNLPSGTREFDTDIYMGKTFRDAVAEWLQAHQLEIPIDLTRMGDLSEIATEMGRVEDEHGSIEAPPTGGYPLAAGSPLFTDPVGADGLGPVGRRSGTGGSRSGTGGSRSGTGAMTPNPVADRLLQHLAKTPTYKPDATKGGSTPRVGD